MLHVPVHFVVFLILLLIIPLKAYTCFIVFALYTYLKEAYIDVKLDTRGMSDVNNESILISVNSG